MKPLLLLLVLVLLPSCAGTATFGGQATTNEQGQVSGGINFTFSPKLRELPEPQKGPR